jgi:hypothetical protein
VSESPKGQGFGPAARTCLASKRFTSALTHDGRATRTSTKVNVRFSR